MCIRDRDKGKLALEELDRNGCLWRRTVLAHLGWASSWEFQRIREEDAKVVHCPNSNQKLGTGGFFPYRDLGKMGITVGIGTDGAASNNSLDMFREMKSMALLQKGQYWDPMAATAEDALRCATVSGNNILGLCGGKVSEGMNADLVVVGIDPAMMPSRRDNLMSSLVYSATGSFVRKVLVGGEFVYNDGILKDGSGWRESYLKIMSEVEGELGL
jgi:cytosine/adenosine deaminase-related metal-dependent hydrolase